MSQPARNLALFLTIGLALLMAFSALGHLTSDRNFLRQHSEEIDRVPGSRAIVLGNSLAAGIDLDAMCLAGTNLSQPLQDPFELTANANLLLSRGDIPHYWFIVLSPLDLGADNGSRASGERQSTRNLAYRLLRRQGHYELIDNDIRSAFTSTVAPSLGLRDWGRLFERVLGPVAIYSLNSPRLRDRSQVRDNLTREQRESALVDRVGSFVTSVSYYDPNVAERTEERLEGLVRDIRAAGAVPLIIVPPMSETLNAKLRGRMPEEVSEFERMLASLSQGGAVVSNYIDHPEFKRSPDAFVDGAHLTILSAATFSNNLGRDLRSQQIITEEHCLP